MKPINSVTAAVAIIALALSAPQRLAAVELVRLTPENWDHYAPAGKEADCIYGDLVLRNDQLVAVIARPAPGRNANMTVRDVGAAIIDLTRRERPNDQLSAYYPGGSRYKFTNAAAMQVVVGNQPAVLEADRPLVGKKIVVEFTADVMPDTGPRLAPLQLRYSLCDGEPFLRVETIHRNDGEQPLVETVTDAIRADRVFRFGVDDLDSPASSANPNSAWNLFWASDEWFGQSYGLICEDRQLRITAYDRPQLQLLKNGEPEATIRPGEEMVVTRKLFPGATLFEVRAISQDLAGIGSQPIEIHVTDPQGPVAHALVAIDAAHPGKQAQTDPTADAAKTAAAPRTPQPIESTYPQASYGLGRTDADGIVRARLPAGSWRLIVRAIGRPDRTVPIHIGSVGPGTRQDIKLEPPGYIVACITDEQDRPIPAKVAFFGQGNTPDPFLGPDTAEEGVHNLYYTHTGNFRQAISPGRYEVLVSYGPEYDVVVKEIEVRQGAETSLEAILVRSVDTRGWVSSDFHSHSSPSGDNVSSQLGRVLNLLCEHLEFAPCTEHNRIDTYLPILNRLGVRDRMATCSGMELTGSPLPVNHQNAFPLIRHEHIQDGGGPQTHTNPIVQIERLALWDENSEKLVQGNHPNLPQILGDRDLNGEPDGGFREMFGFMDVVEVHPPEGIFSRPAERDLGKGPRNPIFHWMQMLNLGYRIPGVVNTDAHYNFHGSGGLRNYIKSSTDDPAKIDVMEMVRESSAGHIVMTNGPFLEVSARATSGSADDAGAGPALPGDDLAAPEGEIKLSVQVQCPNWFDVNRVQIFLNGRPAEKLNFTRREYPDRFREGAVRFEESLPLTLTEDTHIVVATIGEGLTLGRVMGPSWGKQQPIAVSNPIFVDVKGDGFRPNGDRLDFELPVEGPFRHEHN